MTLQFFATDAVIGAQMFSKLRQTVAVGGAGKPRADIAGEREPPLLRHFTKPPLGCLTRRRVVVLVGGRPLKEMDVEGCKVDPVEAHRLGAVTRGPAQIGAGPVEHRHEIVANRPDTGG